MSKKRQAPPVNVHGADFRVKARHPRRDGPLRISSADGRIIAQSGQTCERVSPEDLLSMRRNGYVERVDGEPDILPVDPIEEPVKEDEAANGDR